VEYQINNEICRSIVFKNKTEINIDKEDLLKDQQKDVVVVFGA
jgi:hypothetical protein